MSDDGPLWLRQLRAEVLRRLRAQRSTQAALAAHLGITPKHMSQVLTGKANGSPEMLDRIAEAAGVRIAIVIGDGEPVPLPPSRSRRGRYRVVGRRRDVRREPRIRPGRDA